MTYQIKEQTQSGFWAVVDATDSKQEALESILELRKEFPQVTFTLNPVEE